MQDAEQYSFETEFIQTKLKCEKYKNDITSYKANLKKLINIEIKYDLLKEQFNDIQMEKVKQRQKELECHEKNRISLLGHMQEIQTISIR